MIERYSDHLQLKFDSYERGKDDPNERRAELLSAIEFMAGTFCYVHGMTKVFDPNVQDDDPDNYYMEREWRVLGKITFSATEVSRVLLAAGFAERFRREVPEFKGPIKEL